MKNKHYSGFNFIKSRKKQENTTRTSNILIFSTYELDENAVIRNFLITAEDGKNYNAKHYNLEIIISLGYRINSEKATNFRRWATF